MCRPRQSVCPPVALVSLGKVLSRRIFMKFGIKVHTRADHEGPEGEQMYSSTLTSSSTLDGLGIQRHAPAALPPV